MNSKQAKRLRKQLRSTGTNPAQREYTLTEKSQEGLNPFGLQIIMTPSSTRKVYQQLKKLRKNGHSYNAN